MKTYMLSLFIVILFTMTSSKAYRDHCSVFGKIYVVKDPSIANYRVYVEESESFADIRVFKESSGLYADREGHWNFVQNKSFADYYIYLESSKNMADFSVFYIDQEAFAGCNN